MEYRKLLVPLDGSELAERALSHAGAIARSKHSEIVLFSAGGAGKTDAKSYLDRKKQEMESPGTAVSTAVATGNAAEEIIGFAEKNRIDLIVISTHGRSGIKRWIVGSVAQKVLSGTRVPVFLVKSEAPGTSGVQFNRVLVPLDGSAYSETSLPYVEEMLRESKAEIVLLWVSEPPIVVAGEFPVSISPKWIDKLMTEERQQASRYLAKVKTDVEGKGMKVRSMVVTGKAAWSIVEVAQKEHVDLIAMATQGRTGISRWVLGSVASRVAEESRQPVMLIHPPAPEPAA